MGECLFEKPQDELLGMNLFNLMIPFSACYLKKKFGDSMFYLKEFQSRTFSFTIYSKRAFRKFQRTIWRTDKKEGEKRLDSFSEKEKSLLNGENSVYYKYLQTLTSCATLIELQVSNLEDLLMLEQSHEVKINRKHKIWNPQNGFREPNLGTAVLFITRRAFHIQNFKYSLMKENDQIIKEMERASLKKITKIKRQLDS